MLILQGLDINIYTRDRKNTTQEGNLKIHLAKSTHWLAYMKAKCIDSYAYKPQKVSTDFIAKWERNCVFCDYKMQGKDNKRSS